MISEALKRDLLSRSGHRGVISWTFLTVANRCRLAGETASGHLNRTTYGSAVVQRFIECHSASLLLDFKSLWQYQVCIDCDYYLLNVSL